MYSHIKQHTITILAHLAMSSNRRQSRRSRAVLRLDVIIREHTLRQMVVYVTDKLPETRLSSVHVQGEHLTGDDGYLF